MHRRNAIRRLTAAAADTPVILIHGARQVGKSTLVREFADHPPRRRRYLTLDDAAVLSAATADPAGFIAGITGPVAIDEVQRTPALLLAIKAAVDRKREPGRFLLTGSANVLHLPRIADSLAGRMEIITLWPLSQGEIEGRPEKFIDAAFSPEPFPAPRRPPAAATTAAGTPLLERVLRGGFPEPLARAPGERREAWFAAYLTTILERDVRDLANIEGLADLPRVLALLAARTSGLLNLADLSRGLSIPATTLKRYLALLQTIFAVVTIPAWHGNRSLRLTKSPKVILADTGFACYLLGATAERLARDPTLRGALVENFVALELLKQASGLIGGPALHHFRTAGGQEADLVLEDRAGRIVGIEVKSCATVKADDFRGLRALADAAGKQFIRGIVLYDGPETVSFGENLLAAPITSLWS